ncbi:acetylcholine receptor subunit alpha-type acr-16 [Tetranychus urticae]|uniref:Uncharacterized protein n=1 Tax=Tetranychus urticae TaxID=32264 RepID=T1JSJ8_TETUR|nr:acetylcholine receptor subunit alpha-type acr-16 [Tetranychus urticae]
MPTNHFHLFINLIQTSMFITASLSASSESSCLTSATSANKTDQLTSTSKDSDFFTNQSAQVVTNVDQDEANQTNDERRLFNYLMRNYEKNVRPVKNAANPIVVRLGITLTQIFDLDEKNQILTTNIWLDQEWIDDFLTWDVKQFGNVSKIRIPCELIWLPDIVLYNSADDYTRGYMNSRAIVEPNGNVFWAPPTKFYSTCPVDVTYFPFDDQTCYMKFGSWIYDGFQVDLCNRTTQVDLENYVHNGEWDLLEAKLNRNVIQFPCCIEPFPDIKIMLTIRRKTLYYMYNIVLPCMMMSILTLLVFCLPPDSGEKVALGVTVLLAFSVIMLAISEKLPETSESIPLLGIYLTTVMAITSVSVIMTVIVLNFHYRGPTQSEIPDWLKKILLSEVNQKPFNLNSKTNTGKSESSKNIFPDKFNFSTNFTTYPEACNLFSGFQANMDPPSLLNFLDTPSYQSGSDYLKDSLLETGFSVDKDFSNVTSFSINNANNNNNNNNASEDRFNSVQFNLHRNCSPSAAPTGSTESYYPQQAATQNQSHNQPHNQQQHQQKQQSSGPRNSSRGLTPQEEIVKILKYLLWRQELEDHHNRVVHEWRLLALAIDKILFWVFLAITLTSSLSFLVIIPIQRRGFSLASIKG